jgi:PKD repeat protein
MQSTADGYWVLEAPVPVPRQDNVVIAYGGLLYALGGYGSGGASFRYDPANDAWTQLATMSPEIEYPADGCLGYDAQGEPVVVLLPDTLTQDVMMVYNIADDTWTARSVPSPLPSNGIWHPDIASDPAHNVCYISGGATFPGLGDLNTLYAYYPATHSVQQLPGFTTARAYHASWFIPQWGEQGYVCIAGGGNLTDRLDSTQCYDVASATWRPENADLGALLHAWDTMADALKVVNGTPQLWIMGGVVGAFQTSETAYYAVGPDVWMTGPHLPYAVYRPEADTLEDEVYVVGGDAFDFDPVSHTQHHLQEPLPPCVETPIFFDDFEGEAQWTSSGDTSLWHTEPQTGACGSLVAPFPSPATAWYYGDVIYGCTYNTPPYAPNEGYLTLDATLPITGTRYATVHFWSYEQTQCGSDNPDCPYDTRFLEVSYNGGTTWTPLWRGLTEDAWYPVTVTTHVDPGNSLRLRFFFDSIDDVSNAYLGWLIDDVAVTACLDESVPPQAGFQVSSPACAGQPLAFSNTTSGPPPLTYTWAFGDGSPPIYQFTPIPITHTYSSPGLFTVTLTATNPYGSDAASQSVSVGSAPTAAFSAPASACAGQPVSFSNHSQAALIYTWAFGDGGASTAISPTHVYTVGGVYTAVLTAANACGVDSLSASLSITLTPTAAFSYTPALPQPGQWVQFTDRSSDDPIAWNWDFGDGYQAALQHPQHAFSASGAYTVTLAAANACGWGEAIHAPLVVHEPWRVYLPVILK